MSKKIFSFLHRHWGTLLLLFILAPIVTTSIKPGFFIIGWDNFSIDLNPLLNFPRTLFATWRGYRGLGVPSDSEVVDTFRLIFYLLASPFPHPELHHQLYLCFTLITGILGIYLLSRTLIYTYLKNHHLLIEVSSILAALLYLFNLQTLSTFWFPMPMYVIRQAFLPWIVWIFIKFYQTPKPSRTLILSFIIICLLSSPSYITATLFITVIFLLATITITLPQKTITSIKFLSLFLLFNLFWLAPFTNYYLHKAPLLPLASTFIEVNELQLNQSPSHFHWQQLLTFYPGYFYTQAKNTTTDQNIYLHPQVANLNASFPSILYLLPFLGLIGTTILLLTPKRLYLRWIAITTLITIFLLRKEYPPTGFIYDWLGTHLPLFKIIFRFGDTKFYPLIALTLPLSAAIAIADFLTLLQKLLRPLLTSIVALTSTLTITFLLAHTFSLFFQGGLISPLMYNQIPPAYHQIASLINSDPEEFRVAHLPMEVSSYWKPYTWGYEGSTFLAFLLNKPLIDRTFEPGSLENDLLDQALTHLTINSDQLDPQALADTSDQFLTLLQKTNVKYLILDHSINPQITSRDQTYWGIFPTAGTQQVVNYLASHHHLTLVNSYSISSAPHPAIDLYLVKNTLPLVSTISSADFLNPLHQNLVTSQFLTSTTWIQSPSTAGSTLPFYLEQLIPTSYPTSYQTTLPLTPPFTLSSSPSIASTSAAINISLSQTNSTLTVYTKLQSYPLSVANDTPTYTLSFSLPPTTTPQNSANQYLSDWSSLPFTSFSPYRLSINNFIIPIPSHLTSSPTPITTILTDPSPLSISLLVPTSTLPVDLSQFHLTDKPNCYNDQQPGYTHDLSITNQSLNLNTTNGTTCITQPLALSTKSNHAELTLTYSLTATNSALPHNFDSPSPYQHQIQQFIDTLPTANYATICLLDHHTGSCLNNHQSFSANPNRTITIPTATSTDKFIQTLLTIPTINLQQVNLNISSSSLTTYHPVATQTIDLAPTSPPLKIDSLPSTTTLDIPKILSPYSYYFNPQLDALRFYNTPCVTSDQYRTYKTYSNFTLTSTFGCQTGVYVRLPFNNNNFYLWQIDYNLLSGKTPKFSLKSDSPNLTYIDQYLSLNQGYPNLPDFKLFQTADSLDSYLHPTTSTSTIPSLLNHLSFRSTSTYLYPQPGLHDTSDKLFTILHQSENPGITAIKDINLTALPPSWQNFSLNSPSLSSQFSTSKVTSSQQLLPSLWQIHLTSPTTNQDTLLSFGQAYDDQWHLYHTNNPFLALLGRRHSSATHVKLNGLTNGWIIPQSELSPQPASNHPQSTTYLALYTPERLAIIGWALTLASLTLSLAYFWTNPRSRRHQHPSPTK